MCLVMYTFNDKGCNQHSITLVTPNLSIKSRKSVANILTKSVIGLGGSTVSTRQ